jgi:hypothetical protein
MTDNTMTARLRMNRKQALLVGVLASVLVGVLYTSYDGSAAPDAIAAATSSEARASTARRNAATSPTVVPGPRWPKVALDQTLSHNPFAEPEAKPESRSTTSLATASTSAETAIREMETETTPAQDEQHRLTAATLAKLQNQKVSMILLTGKKTAAVIGGHLIHEGDLVDGVRIVSILPNGVLVEPAPVD